MRGVLLLLCLWASAASAEILTGEEFDARARGSTMYFNDRSTGAFYGSEQFFSDRRTVWRNDDGRCVNGKWSYKAPEICFVYDDGSGPFCWIIEAEGRALSVTSVNDPSGAVPLILDLFQQDKTPILCSGPLFGV